MVGSSSLRRLGSPFYGSLDDDSTATHSLVVADSGLKTLLVVCDADCAEVEISILDDAGRDITPRDAIQEEVVVFRAPRPGTFRVMVLMKSCQANPCYYGVQAFTP